MELFLQIVGGVIVTIALLGLTVYLYFRIKLRKYWNLDEDQDYSPLTIHLNEDFSPSWLSNTKIQPIDGELSQLGFERGKSYRVPELQDAELTAYFKTSLIAVLYRHEIAGVWVDFTLEKENGGSLTVTNSALEGTLEYRPQKKVIQLKEKTATQLYEHISSYVEGSVDYKTCTPENFRDFFEEEYKKDMAYQARNGGISFEAFLKSEKALGIKTSEKNIREAFLKTKEQELGRWEGAATEEFFTSLSEKEQESMYDDSFLFIVPFHADAEAFIRYLNNQDFIDDEDGELGKKFKTEVDIFKLFDKLNEGKSPELRATLISETSYPLQLKIYKCKYSY